MEKLWLKHYPEGVPAEIDPDAYASIVDILETSCRDYADKPAFTNMGVELTYAQLDRLSLRFAAFLQQDLDLARGDRVAIMMPNLLQYPVVLFGILRAGMVAVNVNPMYTPRELEHQLNDADARAIVIVDNFAHTLEQVRRDVPVDWVITTAIGDLFPAPRRALVNFVVRYVRRMVPSHHLPAAIRLRDALARGAARQLETPRLAHEDIAFLQYTGGTTGVSKGAILTHGNVVSNMLQARAWISSMVEEGREIVITALPLYHIFSLTANCLIFVAIGGLNVLITNPRDLKTFTREIGRYPFTVITGVNTLFNALLHYEPFRRLDFSHLKVALGGGMAVQRAVAERWKELTGVPLIEAYGLTETSPAAAINPLDLEEYNGKIGMPIPSTEMSIQDDEGHLLPTGETGEICIRGPQVMHGYWRRPEETARTLDERTGWLHTGDMGMMDQDGYFRVVDRKKDMINVSGFNVFPNEVEEILAQHPGVVEAAVVGIPDEKSGETIKAFVVPRDDGVTRESIIEHCRKSLTAYKVPKQIEFRDELPKSNVGKILRKELR
ncbi:MAG TPA: AMP-binding protein [Gammaproteobacteria bacterium]|nr:AMP-binding protein [Gammaproteobacteria bacterium]